MEQVIARVDAQDQVIGQMRALLDAQARTLAGLEEWKGQTEIGTRNEIQKLRDVVVQDLKASEMKIAMVIDQSTGLNKTVDEKLK